MESIWIPCGFHPFHMEYVLAGISLILVIPFHFYSIWIPYGIHLEWSYSINIPSFHMECPYGIHMEWPWIPYGMTMDSIWNDHGFHME